MALPANGIAWPPKALASIAPTLAEWSAWYAGQPEQLRAAYQASTRVGRPAQYAGGIVGGVARLFWGRPRVDLSQPVHALHVPLAGDLASASADLLFSEPPTITVTDTTTQERVNAYLDDGLHSALVEAAEVSSALGGVFLRVVWDTTLSPRPFLSVVHADQAWPEFSWGRLRAVTFWRVVQKSDSVVVRHLERHELNEQGHGVILHGLYSGTRDNLGRAVPLTEHDATRAIADLVDQNGSISTGTPGLAVAYIPNITPNRLWRLDPVGAHLGRSDYDGVEGLMDALDETYTSWMRDIRLGKGRIIAAESMLTDLGPGQGAVFDADREIWAPVKVLMGRDSTSLPLEAVQFEIRVQEHMDTVNRLTADIMRSAGYAAATFGESSSGGAQTATEVTSRERRSYLTRDRKVRLWKPALAQIVEKLLTVDQVVLRTPRLKPERPRVAFADAVSETPAQLAQTAQLLAQAEAASVRTLVQIVHPDWDDPEVDREVAAIRADRSNAPDPFLADGQQQQ